MRLKHIAVFGCGWFGLPLAKALQQAGFTVSGSKTTAEGAAALTAAGIRGVVLQLTASQSLPADLLEDCDALVVNIPPGLRRGEDDYLHKLSQLAALVKESRVQRLVFVSSTGAYQQEGVLTEADLQLATSGSSAILQQAERMFQQLASDKRNVTIIRFAGLVGPARHPGRFMAGRTGLTGASQAVNLVHLDDCITAVISILKAPQPAEVYNLSAPLTLDKQTFYCLAAEQLGLPVPQFVAEEPRTLGKRIDGSFICRDLGFSYRYTDANSLLQACDSCI
jgi:nucleoside-diphosphate-sugar epimerase